MIRVTFEGKNTIEVCDQMWDFINSAIAQPIPGQPVQESDGDPMSEEEAAAAEAADDTSAEQTQPEVASEPAATSDVSADDVVQALRNHVKKHGRDSAIAILTEFGAERASDIKLPEDRAAALEKLNG